MPTVVIGNNTGDNYSGVEDIMLKEHYPNSNFNNSDSFEIAKNQSGDHSHSLIRFSGLSNLPSDITVSESLIYMYCREHISGTRTATARRVLRNWVASSCSWNLYMSGNSWTAAGCLSDGNDRSATASGTMTMNGTGYKSLSGSQLSTDISNIASGTYSNTGWHFERTDGSNNSTWDVFTSSEGTDGQRPYLSVTYTESGGGSLPAIINNHRQQGVM